MGYKILTSLDIHLQIKLEAKIILKCLIKIVEWSEATSTLFSMTNLDLIYKCLCLNYVQCFNLLAGLNLHMLSVKW